MINHNMSFYFQLDISQCTNLLTQCKLHLNWFTPVLYLLIFISIWDLKYTCNNVNIFIKSINSYDNLNNHNDILHMFVVFLKKSLIFEKIPPPPFCFVFWSTLTVLLNLDVQISHFYATHWAYQFWTFLFFLEWGGGIWSFPQELVTEMFHRKDL